MGPSENIQVVNSTGGVIANLVNKLTAGTAGYETGAASPSTDISGGSATTFKIQNDGDDTARSVTLTLTGLNTGVLIAAAVQAGIRALAGIYAAVTCTFTGGVYVITSGTTGTASKVRITAGASNDVAAALKIGAANGAIATDGTSTPILTANYTAPTTTRSRLMVASDTAGILSLTKDGYTEKLNGGTALTAGVTFINTPDIPLIAGSAYNLAFSVGGARLQVSWIRGV